MILVHKQQLFSRLRLQLELKIQVTPGFRVGKVTCFRDTEWYRRGDSSEEFKRVGHPNSLHGIGLAADIDLWKWNEGKNRWVYCTDTEDHRQFGEWWEQQHELCRWGGRFNDGNHYSLEHNGIK